MQPQIPKTKLIVFLVGSVLLISFSFYLYQIIYTPNVLLDRDDRLFVIKRGTSYRSVLESLGKEGFVNDMVSFSFLARLKNFDRTMQPGRYMLRRNMTNLDAIRALQAGRTERINVTFTNVRLLSELNEKITKNIGVTPGEFEDALLEFISNNKEGFTKANVLAMFIPNTYQIYYNVVPEELVERMHDEYESFWNEQRRAKATALGLTPIEVSILASIVQAETIKSDEAPIIAGLYLNRLKKDIPLQADPTLKYAVGDFTIKRVLNVHKEVESPYNTYKYAGLPPGPINMPSIENIDAVLNYTPSDFIYMCAKEDFSGYHNFAATLREHNINATRYQAALTAEMRKGAALRKKK
ncbi:MAG TPA: endolytic transglycosylase MltG [Cyclobacteriaceae bacterium]|nr:endolytic transglycosylase MltG [Cyclobacteriaceae bacterium]